MNTSKTHQGQLAAYIRYFENLTSENVNELEGLAREDFAFADPFNNLTNRRDAVRLFRRMFDDVNNPDFKISASFWNEDGTSAILKWRFTGETDNIGRLEFEGLSEIHFDEAGLITRHIDYWDAAIHFYEKIPLLGAVLRMIRKKLRLS